MHDDSNGGNDGDGGNGNSADGERGIKYEQSSEEALAALIAAVGDGQHTHAAKLVGLVRDVTHLGVETSMTATKRVADLLLAAIGAQTEEIATLKTRVARLEKTAIALIQRQRVKPRESDGGEDEEGLQ
jgi:hypothetical protein